MSPCPLLVPKVMSDFAEHEALLIAERLILQVSGAELGWPAKLASFLYCLAAALMFPVSLQRKGVCWVDLQCTTACPVLVTGKTRTAHRCWQQ